MFLMKMLRKYLTSFISVLFLGHFFVHVQSIVVRTHQGELKGTKDVSRGGFEYFSFRGVPYAKPPVGDLRFKDPQSPEPWTGVREAQKYADHCIQFGWNMTEGVYGSEDCLYLNVFTPQVNNTNGVGLPVLFWIHGGTFIMGAGSLYGPDYFMDKPLVVVTINYRLGALGFLHFDDKELPGNYGMKDQVAALQWVQNNIRAFGGDPTNVTIAGQSVGGSSVHWHMFSSQSKGLFHRAISQSGSALAVWAEIPKRVAKEKGLVLTRLVGCHYKSVRETVKCLKRVPANELVKAQLKFAIWSYHPVSLAIVPEDVDKSAWKLRTSAANVPWLIGFTSREEEGEMAGLLLDDGYDLRNLEKNHQMLLPLILMYDVHSQIQTQDELDNITARIREFYLKNETINKNTSTQLGKAVADNFAVYDITEAALSHRGVTYFYVFDHLPEHSYTELVNKDYKPGGPAHCDDLTILFNTTYFPLKLNSADRRMSELMINMWTNFIATGNPNSADLGFHWSPLSGSKIEFLNISQKPEMKPWYWQDRFSFWQSLYLRNESSSFH